MAKLRVPVLETFEFQKAILDKDLSTPPVAPVEGDRYIVAGVATGDFTGKEKNIAWYNGLIWKFDAPKKGMLLWVDDEGVFYFYNNVGVWQLLTEAMGLGDMLKSTYDSDNDGIVDKSETIDDGAGNSSTAVDVKDAVTKKHAHANQATLDSITAAFTTSLKTAYDDAVTKAHAHANQAILDAINVSFTTILKGQYDVAYSSRAIYNTNLGCIEFNI